MNPKIILKMVDVDDNFILNKYNISSIHTGYLKRVVSYLITSVLVDLKR